MTLTPAPLFTATLFASLSSTSVFQESSPITINAGGTYSLNLQPLATLGASHLTGTVALSLCYDAACSMPAPGSPVSLPYDLTIVAPPAAMSLTPSTITGDFIAGSPFPFNITVKASPSPLVSGPIYVSVTDPTGTFGSSASFGYLDASKPYTLLELQAASSLPAGSYSGNLLLNVCSDSTCQHPALGSPVTVPFNVTVAPAPANSGLTSLSPWPGIAGWNTYQANAAHTGFVPVTLDPSVFAYRWVWISPSSATDGKKLSTLVVSGGQLYVDAGHVLYAVKESDHSVVWTHDFSNILYAGFIVADLNPPAVSGSRVFVTTSAQSATFMFGLSASDGSLLFQSPMQAQWEDYFAPTISNGIVYTDGGEYGGMYAFDSMTGTQDFFATEQQYDEWTPAVDANYAYAYTGGVLSWVDAKSGAPIGSITDPNWQWLNYSIRGAPVLGAANSVFAVNVGNVNQNSLVNFNTSTKAVVWSSMGPYGGNPAYASGVVYGANKSPMRLEARSEATGALQWSWSPPTSGETSYVGDVLVTKNLVFLSTNAAIYAIDTTTHQSVWSAPTSGFLALSENGVLYIVESIGSGTTGRIYAVNVK